MLKSMRRALLLPAVLLLAAGCAGQSSAYRQVTAPMVNLRSEPRTEALPGVHDPHQETQLVYGEMVKVVKEDGGWAQIEAVEQAEFNHNGRWQGYPGWIPSDSLVPANPLLKPNILVSEPWAQGWLDAYRRSPSKIRFPLGARLHAIDMGGAIWRVELPGGGTVWLANTHAREIAALGALPAKDKRRLILESAGRMIGQPYYWGGLSVSVPGLTNKALGVDCSGLVNLTYRLSGVDVPRDALEQYLRAKKVAALQPADLIFLSSKEDPLKIVHVMIYAGGGDVFEAPGTGQTVRRIGLTERLGRGVSQLAPGDIIDGQTVYFGSYL